jgi:hypothetical protein
MSNVITLADIVKEDTSLHNGEKFKTVAEHEAYIRGIDHACASIEIWLDNLRENARIKQNGNGVS